MKEELKIGDYFWIDNSVNNDIPGWNLLARVIRINPHHVSKYNIEAKILNSGHNVTCWGDNNGVWGIGKKANVKIKTNPYLAGLAALTNHEIKMGTIS